MPTKAQLKQEAQHIKYKIRRGDRVVIIAGKDKGEKGLVVAVSPKEQRVLVVKEDPNNPDEYIPLNARVKHFKAKFQGQRSAKIRMPGPLHISNVMVLDPKSGEATRIGRRVEDGKLVRYSKKTNNLIPDTELPQPKN